MTSQTFGFEDKKTIDILELIIVSFIFILLSCQSIQDVIGKK